MTAAPQTPNPDMKPGWQTTEFLTSAVTILGALGLGGTSLFTGTDSDTTSQLVNKVVPAISLIVSYLTANKYTSVRTQLKAAQPGGDPPETPEAPQPWTGTFFAKDGTAIRVENGVIVKIGGT